MKNTVATFKKAKEAGKKLSMLTAYDYSTASLLDAAGINGILVLSLIHISEPTRP